MPYGHLPCLKIGGSWRIRRGALENFIGRSEQPATLAGELGSFLDMPDNVLALVPDLDWMHRLDVAFFRVGEEMGGLLVKLYGGRPAVSEDEMRADLEQQGLQVSRLESEGRFRLISEHGSADERKNHIRDLLEEGGAGRTVWASFNWAERVDFEEALHQQEVLTEFVEREHAEAEVRLVVMTTLREEVFDEWPAQTRRRARREVHSGIISSGSRASR